MGEPPDWYPLVRAARYGNVAPWELHEHQEWIDPLLAAQWAERKADEDRQPGR